MAAESRSVVVRLTAENVQYIAAMQASGTATVTSMKAAEAATMRQSQAIDTLGSKAGKAGAAAAVGLAAMGKAAVDWESQWAGVEKTVDGTAGQMAELEGELRGLAKTMPATHEEIAGVAEAAGQLGVAREDISAFTETMLQLGATTTLTAEDAATSIAQMANVMSTAPDEIDNVGAALVALGNDGASTERQIIEMAQRIAGAGAQIGLAESDILAIANAASSMGIEVEAGGTAISKVFTEMAKATAQGGEDLDAFAEVAGLSAEEFARAFEEDPARAFASFTAGLDQINASGGDVFTVLDELGFADVRVSRALLSMAASGDLLTDSLDLGADAFARNTALTDEYGKRVDTTASQARIAWNQIKDAGISAGNELLPVIAKTAGVVGDLADAFGHLPGPVRSSLTGLLGITALLGGGVWFTSKIIGGVTSTRAALAELATTSPRAARGLSAVVKAGAGLAALEIGTGIIDTLREAAKGAAPDIDELNAALAAVDAAGLQEALGGSLSDLLDAADTGTFEDLSIGLGKTVDQMSYAGDVIDVFVPGLHGAQDQADRTADSLNSLDEALAGLAATGGTDRAVAAFRQLAEAEDMSASEQQHLIDLLPAYRAAVGDAADGTDTLARQQGFLQGFFETGSEGAYELADGLDEVTDSAGAATDAMEGLSGFLDREAAARAYAESLRDAAKALKDGFQPKDVETIQQIGREIESVAETLADKPSKQRTALQQAKEDLEGFIETNPRAKAEFADMLKFINQGLKDLDDSEAEPEIGADTSDFDRDEVSVRRRHKALDFLKANPKVDLNDAAFSTIFQLTAADLAWLDRQLAKPKVDVDPTDSFSVLGRVGQMLNGLHDKTIYVTTHFRRTGSGQGQAASPNEADGGFYQGGVKAYVDGGMNYGRGRPMSRQPMMVQGGANILWGEPETGWEAYISGKPSERERNIAILGMAANRLGVAVTQFADGGTRGTDSFLTHVPGQLDSMSTQRLFREWNYAIHNASQGMREWTAEIRREFQQRIREAHRRTEALREELNTAREVRDGWREAMDSIQDTVVDKLTSDWFADVQGVGGADDRPAAFEDIIARLQANETQADAVSQAIGNLSRLGLEEDALQALIEQTSPEQLIDFASNWTQQQVDQFEQLFNSAQDARESAGLTAGIKVFGERENAAAMEVQKLRVLVEKAEVREERLAELAEKADRRADRMEELAEDNPKETGDALADALNGAGGRAARKNGRPNG